MSLGGPTKTSWTHTRCCAASTGVRTPKTRGRAARSRRREEALFIVFTRDGEGAPATIASDLPLVPHSRRVAHSPGDASPFLPGTVPGRGAGTGRPSSPPEADPAY